MVAQAHRESIRPSEDRMLTSKKASVVTGRADMRMSNGLMNQPVIVAITTYAAQDRAAQMAA